MYARNERLLPKLIEDEMKSSYLNYAMSVIVGRALPDIRDGLKPVHRRILYAMKDLNLEHQKPYKKCARIVGETLGKYHPHGDTAVYDALVRMVQDFSLRYPLIDGQGNFGSLDGDAAAAMRYTEARLERISDEMLADLEKETVEFVPNFDETLEEPAYLPARMPNLLVNGSSGIAVGMATNFPPHSLGEIVDGVIMLIDQPEATVAQLMKSIPGPDFPTGGVIRGLTGIRDAYHTGRGLVKVFARTHVETKKGEREQIIITEIPYQVNKANLIESIAELVQAKKVAGISDLRDESDKDGVRVVIELKRDADAKVILNQLYHHTQMQTTFGVIMLALVDRRPRLLTLKDALNLFIEHRKDIIVRRTRFDLKKAQDRAHILEGLKIALDNLDRVIAVIRQSKTTPEAKEALMKKFSLSDVQAQAILEMQLQRLTGLERQKIEDEYLELIKKIALLKSILENPRKVLEIIKQEALELKSRYADARRTEIVPDEATELAVEDLIAEEDMVITVSHSGYIKRQAVSLYRKQRRGGRGVSGAQTREEDFIERLFIASTHDYVLVFTSKGRVYWLKVYEIPEGGRASKGRAIINMISLGKDETISTVLAVREFREDRYVMMATREGQIKKTNLSRFGNPRRDGIVAIGLREKDLLIGCELTDGNDEILLATREGKAVRFNEDQVREMGRTAAGVRGVSLGKKDFVINLVRAVPDATLLTVTEKGFAKRTLVPEYRLTRRGGKGVINIKTTAKNGSVAGLLSVTDEDELMVITSSAMVVRCAVRDIRPTGRSTQGVKLIALKADDRVVSVARLAAREEDEGEEEETKANGV